VVNHQNLTAEWIHAFFGPRGARTRTFPNHQDFDFDGLVGRAMSSSYVPTAGQPGHDELLAALRTLFAAHAVDGRVRFEYDTRLYFGSISGY
jgi:hypothetical protein